MIALKQYPMSSRDAASVVTLWEHFDASGLKKSGAHIAYVTTWGNVYPSATALHSLKTHHRPRPNTFSLKKER
jgi:hypothetical protein